MYSGFTLTDYSGRIIGAHQKIDRAAREHLGTLINGRDLFPSARSILKFEGKNGPDGIKRKSPGKNEPEHYFSPFDENDHTLINIIDEHYKTLVCELKNHNKERIAFEAAWLAHSLVDGLTPAHHYPYQKELSKLLKHGKKDQFSVKEKLVMPGKTAKDKIKNNWKMWGPKGLMFTHGLFELGSAVLLAPMSFEKYKPSKHDIKSIQKLGAVEYFINKAREIAILDIYEIYSKKGWTPRLSKIIRNKLGPAMVNTVTLVWYSALYDAGIIKKF